VAEASAPPDAGLVSCTNIRVLEAIARLEADLGLAVVVPGYCRLLAEAQTLPAAEAVAAGR
jgi:maleate cis-trans isomerase